MSFNFGYVLLSGIVVLAFVVSEWQIAAAFLVAIIAVPLTIVFSTHIYEVVLNGETFNISDVFMVSSLFILGGIPLYFAFVMPLYYALNLLSFPVVISFPLAVTAFIVTLFVLFATGSWGYLVLLVVAACSAFHSLFILWLISIFKSIAWSDL